MTDDQLLDIRDAAAGRFASYPVWLTATVVVRGAQLCFIVCCIWYLSALFDAMDKSRTISTPPWWLWLATIILGTGNGFGPWRWKLSPVGDAIAKLFASHTCPTCGHDIFDPTPPSGYHAPTDRQAFLPSRICANCGHDLTKKGTA